MASQITKVTIVYSTFYSGADQRKQFRVVGLCVGNSPVTGEFPAQMASIAENVSISCRHHITKTKQSTTKPCVYFMGCTVMCVFFFQERTQSHTLSHWFRFPSNSFHPTWSTLHCVSFVYSNVSYIKYKCWHTYMDLSPYRQSSSKIRLKNMPSDDLATKWTMSTACMALT